MIGAIAIVMGCLFITTYSLALGDPAPHRIDAALVGDAATHARTVDTAEGVANGKLDSSRYASVPAALEWFAEVNPFTTVVDAMRHLWLGTPAGNDVWGAVVWCLAILAVFAPLSVAKYRRAVTR